MIGKIIGAVVGDKVARRAGNEGWKGAVVGAAAASVARRSAPLAVLIGGGLVAKKLVDKRRDKRIGHG